MEDTLEMVINKKLTELDMVRSRMETVRLEFIQATGAFVGAWYDKVAKAHVGLEPERTAALGSEKLSMMKKEVSELSERAGDIAKEHLSKPALWWHLVTHFEKHQMPVDYDNSKEIDSAIRFILGVLAPILEEYGYLKEPTGEVEDKNIWRESDEIGGYYLKNGKSYYPYVFVWSGEMKVTFDYYNTLLKQAMKVFNEIIELKLERGEQEARELWDSL